MSKYTFPELHESGFSGRDSRMAFVRRMVTLHEFKTAKLCRQAELSIINESTDPDCGENVGTSSNPSAAPEVAASDEDGDGDGDGEDDRGLTRHLRGARPHHRAANVQSNSCRLNSRQGANMDQKAAIPFVVEHFDRVSDATHIDIAALKAITGKSRATLYRWIDRGILPKPRKLGPTHNFWLAGDIRRALSA